MSDDDCTWCEGLADGYRVGPNSVEPNGQPITVGYNEDLFADPEYRRGLSAGRADHIDEMLRNGEKF